jgi:glycogen operon protein
MPEPWAEWNGEYRDSVRRAWRCEREPRGQLGRLATALTGSSDVYGGRRRATASVNFVACHDGSTLADLTRYARKHNEINGEGNGDGPAESFASNWGVEGETTEPTIVAARTRAMRNVVATLALSLGVPMLQQGDELGRTQHGLDNGYCQDGPLTWVDWSDAGVDDELLAFVREAFTLRRSLAVFRRREHFTGAPDHGDARDLAWLHPDGREMAREEWDEALAVTALYDARSVGDGRLALVVNLSDHSRAFALPPAERWQLRLATSTDVEASMHVDGAARVGGCSIALLQADEEALPR